MKKITIACLFLSACLPALSADPAIDDLVDHAENLLDDAKAVGDFVGSLPIPGVSEKIAVAEAVVETGKVIAGEAIAIVKEIHKRHHNKVGVSETVYRKVFDTYDKERKVEPLFASLFQNKYSEKASRHIVRILERAFVARQGSVKDHIDRELGKILRMTFKPHAKHFAYVINKAVALIADPETAQNFIDSIGVALVEYAEDHELKLATNP